MGHAHERAQTVPAGRPGVVDALEVVGAAMKRVWFVDHVDVNGRIWRSMPFEDEAEARKCVATFRKYEEGPSCFVTCFAEHPDGHYVPDIDGNR
jgi:hypothetical protein